MSVAHELPLEAPFHPALHDYGAQVVERKPYREFETTETGGTIYSELVRLEDTMGRVIVREVTIGEPNSNVMDVIPYPVVETDPWTTGARGLNRDKIRSYTNMGFHTVWVHHAGKESPIGKDKSTSRSAHQMHAVLDDLAPHHNADLSKVIVRGYSRGDMTGEKFIIVADQHGRSVPASDMDAVCFARDMSRKEKIETVILQIPTEAVGVGKLAVALTQRAWQERSPDVLLEYAQTLDLHPRNLIQEAMWMPALVNANVGKAIERLPVDTVGVRTAFKKDIMSQQKDCQELYARLPGIQVLTERGPHVAGAHPEYLAKSLGRLSNIGNYVLEHDMSIDGITTYDISPAPTAAEISKTRWGLRVSS